VGVIKQLVGKRDALVPPWLTNAWKMPLLSETVFEIAFVPA
jgi:hypothetical protein